MFRILSLPAGNTIADFSQRTNALNAAQKTLLDPNMESRDDLIYFSCLPWLPVLSLTNERHVDPDDCIPRVGWGNYQMQNGRLILPICLEVNHKTVDGLHIGRLYEYLQNTIDNL